MRGLLILAALLLGAARPGHAQDLHRLLPRPHAEWLTVETRYFVVHYPRELGEWTRTLVERLDSVHATVSVTVGNAPAEKITVVVDDPVNEANGSANPGPLIYLWPTPPDPRSTVGDNRTWAELLAVHEYAHIAHLDRRFRNPAKERLRRLLPTTAEPILLGTPRWAIEGYATLVEGVLTGTGRPHGVWRPAVLRQWAIEGALPSYGALNRTSGFYGGSMAYLAGSAYLEWLVAQHGEKSLSNVWRRMTARQARTFDEAFAGVFGAPPDELYGRFTAELTGRALELERRLVARGLVQGEQVQRLSWFTGDPAISPDGQHMAIVLRAERRPSRMVIWTTAADTLPERDRLARARARELDPHDVPDIDWRPRPKRAIATLLPVGGREHDAPRFLPDGKRVLVLRAEATADGQIRRDLFIWSWESGGLRRVTRGAGIRHADPTPDGQFAVGARCLQGICDVVRVDLGSGDVTVLAAGSPTRALYRPRVSPDGGRIALSVQEGSRWRLAVMERSGANMRFVDPDDGASRFDAAWLPGGTALVAVSDRGGIYNLERLDLASGDVWPITRVTGAAIAPEPNAADSSVFFLSLRSRGYDLRRIRPDSAPLDDVVALDTSFAPAARVPAVLADTFGRVPFPEPRPYGIGPRAYLALPQGYAAAEGRSVGLSVTSTDPVGRLTWQLQGLVGNRSGWEGGALAAVWRGRRPSIHGELFAARQRPSRQHVQLTPQGLDADYLGATTYGELRRDLVSRAQRVRVGASAGRLELAMAPEEWRRLAFTDVGAGFLQTRGRWSATQSVAVHGAIGSTAGRGWARGIVTGSLGIGRGGRGLRGQALWGATRAGAPDYERFVVGGVRPPLFDAPILSQRVSMPALPVGFAAGSRVLTYRAELVLGTAFVPYYWAATAGPRFEDWQRLIGIETTVDLAAMPLYRLPGVRLALGAGYSLDEPLRKKTRGYLTVGYRP